ncbi:hypothetical protein [Streptomyces sp. NPDC001165]|uniref:hypothetical protein n=1 Tax=Streptomyces sp. NPDC001165 TaxID=3364546 RepID=UPI0036A03FC5
MPRERTAAWKPALIWTGVRALLEDGGDPAMAEGGEVTDGQGGAVGAVGADPVEAGRGVAGQGGAPHQDGGHLALHDPVLLPVLGDAAEPAGRPSSPWAPPATRCSACTESSVSTWPETPRTSRPPWAPTASRAPRTMSAKM